MMIMVTIYMDVGNFEELGFVFGILVSWWVGLEIRIRVLMMVLPF